MVFAPASLILTNYFLPVNRALYGNSIMSVSSRFELLIPECLIKLEHNEWAFTQAREALIQDLEPHQAFESITDVMLLSLKQKEAYVFVNCCWLVMQLARLSQTTEMPDDLDLALDKSYTYALELADGLAHEVQTVANWYRYTVAI